MLSRRHALEDNTGSDTAKTKDYINALDVIDDELDALEDFCPACNIDIATGKIVDWPKEFDFELDDYDEEDSDS